MVINHSNNELDLVIEVDGADVPRITGLGVAGSGAEAGLGLPLVDVILAGEGRGWSSQRYCESAIASHLRYEGHECGDGTARVDLTIGRATAADLRRRLEQMRPHIAGDHFTDIASYLDANDAFHEWIVTLAQNPSLLAMYQRLSVKALIARALAPAGWASRPARMTVRLGEPRVWAFVSWRGGRPAGGYEPPAGPADFAAGAASAG